MLSENIQLKIPMNTQPTQIFLVFQFFFDEDPERQKELNACFEYNLINPWIEKFYVLLEKPEDGDRMKLHFSDLFSKSVELSQIWENKVRLVPHHRRLTFADSIQFCNQYLKNKICILANSDIYFDWTLKKLLEMKWVDDLTLKKKFLALSRYDMLPNNVVRFNMWTASCR